MIKVMMQQLSSQRATCKLCGVLLGAAILIAGALGRLKLVNLLWAAGTIVPLTLAEAGYLAQQRRCVDALAKQKNGDQDAVLPPESVIGTILAFFRGLISLSVWSFYAVLLGIVAAGSYRMPLVELPHPVLPSLVAATPKPPVHPYHPAGTGPIGPTAPTRPSPFLPQVPPGGTPFPGRPPMNPALQRNGPPLFPQRPPGVIQAPTPGSAQTAPAASPAGASVNKP